MNVALKTRWTLESFLAWEERQEYRYEFDGVRPVAMVGVTRAHATVQSNLLVALGNRLRGKPCRAFGSDLKIQVNGRIRYPDVMVTCTPGAPTDRVVHDPVVVFEILSESTADTDLIDKNDEYRATQSVKRYVILQQTHPGAMIFVRKGDEWISELAHGDDAVIRLPEFGFDVPLAELYEGIDFPAETD